jgi:hypothetical protein
MVQDIALAEARRMEAERTWRSSTAPRRGGDLLRSKLTIDVRKIVAGLNKLISILAECVPHLSPALRYAGPPPWRCTAPNLESYSKSFDMRRYKGSRLHD